MPDPDLRPDRPGARRAYGYNRHGWRKRSALDVAAVIAEGHAALTGGKPCAFMDAVAASKKTGVALMKAMTAFPGYSPDETAINVMALSADMWTGEALVKVQTFWAAEIASWPFARLGGHVAELIKARGEAIVPQAWPVLIAWFAAGHPMPKAFFSRPEILAKVPATDELAAVLTALACGRAAHLGAVPLRGGRAV